MNDNGFETGPGRRVPRGRLARLGGFARLTAGVAANVARDGVKRIAAGERPALSDLMLTPANAEKLTAQLANLRGAAMKLGQMLSLDSGDLLPPELGAILARLRERAQHMPPAQLDQRLKAEWGPDWRRRFRRFEATPIAAASIGQVHRAETHDGRMLAIKVQYPGVADSIDADVDNVATLLRMSRLLPDSIDIAPLLQDAKIQLHEEADYRREAEMLALYGDMLADRPAFIVPRGDPALTTDHILAMDFVAGRPIESVETATQAERNRVAALLIDLVLDELFRFGVMQTDPNFANYRYQPETGRIVLLDFGAARRISPELVAGYRLLLGTALSGDRAATEQAAVDAGFMGQRARERHPALIASMVDAILTELERGPQFDFADRAFLQSIRRDVGDIAADRSSWHLPRSELLFVQRKVSGTALLAARLRAVIEMRDRVSTAIGQSPADCHFTSDG